MSLRLKLLLLSLSLLVLPWAGWQAVRELEALLREGQERALIASAEAMARSLAARQNSLPTLEGSLFAHRLRSTPRIDGDDGDWVEAKESSAAFGERGWFRIRLGRRDEQLFLWLSVDDGSLQRGQAAWPGELDYDRVLLSLRRGEQEFVLRLANSESGPLSVFTSNDETPPFRIEGVWQERAGGYDIELALPQGFGVNALALEARDTGATPRRAGSAGWRRLHGYSGALEGELAALAPPDTRAILVDAAGWRLATAGTLRRDISDDELLPWRRWLFRALLLANAEPEVALEPAGPRLQVPELDAARNGQTQTRWRRDPDGARLRQFVAVPVRVQGQLRGALRLERSNSELLLLTDKALGSLLGWTFLAFLATAGVMFAFASRLSARIRRLRDAAEHALDREGRVTPFPRTNAGDEIGDLSRSFASLLDEISAYTDYLRSLAGKLSHELNTPLAIVRTSLDNLDASALPEQALPYLQRARDGVERMGGLVRTMSEVTRIEHAIAGADAENFDLRKLLVDCAESYRPVLAPRQLQVEMPAASVPFRGAPELLAQALDKLIDNARGFCPEDGWVRLSLHPDGDVLRVAVANSGPVIPEAMRSRLFNSLVSLRERAREPDGTVHLGFGLYVVRLVTELHRGGAEAHNLPSGEGVEFVLRLRGMG